MALHRTLVQIEILSDEPVAADTDLAAIDYQITDGGWSGAVTQVSSTEVNRATMAILLTSQGSDPAFLLGDDDEDDEPGERECDDHCLPHREGCDGHCDHTSHVNACWGPTA